jgi:predicted nucleotidyltransferase
MGRRKTVSRGLAGALFSKVQLKVLALVLGQPDRVFHASEIIRLAGSGSGAVQRELVRLTGAGIVSVTSSGNRKLYQASRQSPIFEELHSLMLKTEGLLDPLKDALQPLRSAIDVAFVYGSVAEGKDTATSDVDLMIVGEDLRYGEVFSALQKAERIIQRSVSPNLMSPGEWHERRIRKNAFVGKILKQPKLFVIGTDHELQGIGQSRPRQPAEGGARRSSRA